MSQRRSFTETIGDSLSNAAKTAREMASAATSYATGSVFTADEPVKHTTENVKDKDYDKNNQAAPNAYAGSQGDSEKYGCRPEPPQENIGARQHQMAH